MTTLGVLPCSLGLVGDKARCTAPLFRSFGFWLRLKSRSAAARCRVLGAWCPGRLTSGEGSFLGFYFLLMFEQNGGA